MRYIWIESFDLTADVPLGRLRAEMRKVRTNA
jgi:hypothetical protein